MDNQPQEPKITDPTYQDRDIHIPLVMVTVVIALIVTAFSFFAMKGLFNSYDKRFDEVEAGRNSPVMVERELPSGPLLQVDEAADLVVHLAGIEGKLTGYHWIDESAGIVQIPIDRAIDLVVERGFPIRSAAPEASAPVEDVPATEETSPAESDVNEDAHGGPAS